MCMYICVCVCVCIYIYIYIYIFQKLLYMEEVTHRYKNAFKGGIRCEIQNCLKAEY
jgi:hypothetical protein